MKLYDFPGAPNPRRVKIFAAEKDIELELFEKNLESPNAMDEASYVSILSPNPFKLSELL